MQNNRGKEEKKQAREKEKGKEKKVSKRLRASSLKEKPKPKPTSGVFSLWRSGDSSPVVNQANQIEIPFIPDKIDLADLQGNGKLLTDDQIEEVKSLKEGYYAGSDLQSFDVIHHEGKLWAVYKGGKHALGEGAHGEVRLIQNLIDGTFYVLKQTEEHDTAEKEFNILKSLGMTPIHSPLPNSSEGQALIIMELVPGKNLSSVMDNELEIISLDFDGVDPDIKNGMLRRLMPAVLRLEYCIQAAEELQAIHDKGYLHRDMSPDNLMIDGKSARFVDFGLATRMNARGEARTTLVGPALTYTPELRRQFMFMQSKFLFEDFSGGSRSNTTVPIGTYNEFTDTHALTYVLADLFFAKGEVPEEYRRWVLNNFLISSAEELRAMTEDLHHQMSDEDLQKVLNLFKEMTTRPMSAGKVAERFRTIKEEYVQGTGLKTLPMPVSVLNVTEYLTPVNDAVGEIDLAATKDKKNVLIAKLREYPQVWLIDTLVPARKPDDYLRLKRSLEAYGFIVGDAIFHGTNAGTCKEALDTHLAKGVVPAVSHPATLDEKSFKKPKSPRGLRAQTLASISEEPEKEAQPGEATPSPHMRKGGPG